MDGEKDLGLSVIQRAYLDACGEANNYDRKQARNFLMGTNKLWEKSLRAWCEVAGINPEKIMKKSRELWG